MESKEPKLNDLLDNKDDTVTGLYEILKGNIVYNVPFEEQGFPYLNTVYRSIVEKVSKQPYTLNDVKRLAKEAGNDPLLDPSAGLGISAMLNYKVYEEFKNNGKKSVIELDVDGRRLNFLGYLFNGFGKVTLKIKGDIGNYFGMGSMGYKLELDGTAGNSFLYEAKKVRAKVNGRIGGYAGAESNQCFITAYGPVGFDPLSNAWQSAISYYNKTKKRKITDDHDE